MLRDNFAKDVIDTLSKRVACRCSNPDCHRITAGPNSDAGSWVNIGVAAHITSAAPGGPRYDPIITSEQRRAIHNGIWLCQSCAKLVDSDVDKYTVEVLQGWKALAEAETEQLLVSGRTPAPMGAAIAVSQPIFIGTLAFCIVGDRRLPMVPIDEPTLDPTFYCSGCVSRIIVQSLIPLQTVVIQAFGAQVRSFEPVPQYRQEYGAYPTAISLYNLEFDDPQKAGADRFIAQRYYSVKKEGRATEETFQPVAIDPILPETFDIRLSPKSPGLYVLRVFALTSVGACVAEQDIINELEIVVPPSNVYCPNSYL
jgi:hypothetical protein